MLRMKDVIRMCKEKGLHYFDKDTMEYWGTKIETELMEGNLFVTSEDTFDSMERKYTVRHFDENTLKIRTVDDFQRFETLEQALNFIENEYTESEEN
ncbi:MULTISPECIES: DUF7447 family protein [Erysipelotrichaceae]|uniref:DUF7447 family protein n=1 Tax=Erysipelotrichaceae TaxID=128827 RepID=UPI000E51C7B2|nr:hypothetical protein [Absiella sp. AM27-20]RHU03312.1 hypothetical protein DW716_15940 [Absiella sp. AM27-20]